MKTPRRWHTALTLVSTLLWLAPVHRLATAQEPAVAMTQQQASQQPVDVALGQRGRLEGQLIHETGGPVAGASVMIQHDGQPVGQATTDENGRFVFEGLRSGLYRVSTANTDMALRVWGTGTAPPTASNEIRIISADAAQPGRQYPGRQIMRRRTVLVGLAIAAAIAIPVAVHASTNNDPPSS